MKIFKKSVVLFACLILDIACVAQPKGYFICFSIQHSTYSFPVFRSVYHQDIAKKINDTLQWHYLETYFGQEKDHLFEKIEPNKNDSDSIMDTYGMSYMIKSNTPKVLSIEFSGIYRNSSVYFVYSNFSSLSGLQFNLKDIFTKDGYTSFREIIKKKRIAQIREKQTHIDSSRVRLLRYVVESIMTDTQDNNFYISGGSIFINGDNVVAKSDKYWYDGSLITEYKLPEFKSFLNTYGKQLFGK